MARSTSDLVENIIEDEGLPLQNSEAAVAYLNFLIEPLEAAQRRNALESILTEVSTGYATVKSEVDYENLTLTPWDLRFAILQSEELRGLFSLPEVDLTTPPALPVTVVINGESFNHELNMDVAMGILLFARTAGVNFEMTAYGAPVTYFVEDQDDIYFRYDNYATEDESSLRMEGSDRRYYFFGSDFLQGIKTAAGWFGLDHRAYWNDLRDIDGNSLTFD